MYRKIFVILITLIIFTQLIVINPYSGSIALKDSQSPEVPNKKLLPADANKLLANTPIVFTENCGQLENDDVCFYDQGGSIWFTDDGVWFEVRDELSISSQQSTVHSRESRLMTDDRRLATNDCKRVILKQEFVRANHVKPRGKRPVEYYSNFFYGNDSSQWCTEVPNYQEVYYENLYDGIDLRYYTNENGLKYDLIVQPGADVRQIKIRYEGAEELTIDDFGNLIVKTEIKDITDGALFIYQDYAGARHKVEGRFKIINNSEYSFELLDDYRVQEILVIDPTYDLEYSTYIGGIGWDDGWALAVDINGNAYVTGVTLSFNFPTTPGVYDSFFNGSSDAFVFKLNSNGSTLQYSTFIGGSKDDGGDDIEIDLAGNAFIAGATDSSDFPTTAGANDTSYNGESDIFVLKLNQNGSDFIYSTFIGGTLDDGNCGIAIDITGNAFVAGITESLDFPNTTGAYDTSYNGGDYDAFILKLNHNGSILIYSTFIGGMNYESTYPIVIDTTGNVFVAGVTNSSDFPTTPGAFDRTYNGDGEDDIFVLKLNQNGSTLSYSTFIGGSSKDAGSYIAVDDTGNAFVTGRTHSSNFPTTSGAYDTTFNGSYDAFALKLDHNGSDLIYSTFIGGNNGDLGEDIAVDSVGNAFITGTTASLDFPTTPDAYNILHNGGWNDIFILKLNRNGSTLLYSTYVGGSNSEGSDDIEVDDTGNVFVTGGTFSLDFPNTTGAFDRTFNGDLDVFVLKFAMFNITSLSLLMNTTPINQIHSKYCQYTFRVNITDTVSRSDLGMIRLNLDPLGTNIQLIWDRATGVFSKFFDPNNFVTLESSSQALNNSINKWTINFNVTFNWNYPDENFHDAQAYATSAALAPVWLNATEFYRVENDLMFNGKLKVESTDNRTIIDGGLVRGGEKLNWTGLKVVYEGTTDVYPPDDEVDITIWDEAGNLWSDSPLAGENFTIQTLTAQATNLNGDMHIVNLTGIPPECDKTNITFTFRIDGDNVTFSNPKPDNTTWQTKSTFVTVGVTITDVGGGVVKGSSVMHCFSTDNGKNWSDWEGIIGLKSGKSITPQDLIFLEEGTNNRIRWQAGDSVGNGPVVSDEYRILIDTEAVRFSNSSPSADYESPTEEVEVGITISDVISGVDASTVEYAVSKDDGAQWSSWMSVAGLEDGFNVNVTLNLTFPDGTSNRIKWRASDIAGNGPVESKSYMVIVNTWLQTLIPRVKLWSPPNGSIIPTTSVELFWRLENQNLLNVTYDVYLDTVDPPNATKEIRLMNKSLLVTDLSNGDVYYWTVIPNVGTDEGWCVSGIWTFTVDTSVPVPSVTLLSPENGSIIRSPKPTLQWSIEYEGSEILSYDVYLDTNDPPVEYEKCPDIYFLPQGTLEDNQTYYWKVVPWAGNVKGPESETWSFTVNRDYRPRIELKLTVNPPYLEQLPGDAVSVQATVYNLGELTDTISLSVNVPADADLSALVNEPNTMDASPDGTAEFNITATIAEDAKKDEVVLTVAAVSGRADEYDLVVEEKAELTVKIFGIDKPEDHSSSFLFTFLNILLIIIIIIIILVLVIIVNNRRKRDKEKKSAKETVSVKPGEVPTAVIAVGQAPTVAQLPGLAAGNVAQELPTTTSTTPVLASSPSAAQAPAAQQIPRVPQVPQLPPAQNQTTKPGAGKTIPEPTIATTTSTPTPAVPAPAHEAVPKQKQISAQAPMETDNAHPQEQDKEVSKHQNKNPEPQ